jgi:primosomal protein N' (replication factor Y)
MAAALLPIFGDNLLGPANPPVARIKSLFIRQIMLKVGRTAPVARVRSVLQQTAAKITGQYGADVYFDVDPL